MQKLKILLISLIFLMGTTCSVQAFDRKTGDMTVTASSNSWGMGAEGHYFLKDDISAGLGYYTNTIFDLPLVGGVDSGIYELTTINPTARYWQKAGKHVWFYRGDVFSVSGDYKYFGYSASISGTLFGAGAGYYYQLTDKYHVEASYVITIGDLKYDGPYGSTTVPTDTGTSHIGFGMHF